MKADFDFGNLVYIILMLVFVIFGAANKKKKKPLTASPPVDSDEEYIEDEDQLGDLNTNLKKIFGDYLGVQGSAKTQSVLENDYQENISERSRNESFITDPAYSVIDKVEKEEDLSSLNNRIEHVQDIQHSSIEGMEIDMEKYPSFTQELLNDLDPRQAVLYSEIFKPKYF